MNTLYKTIISLIRSALTGEKASVPADTDWEQFLQLCKEHQISPIIYYGVENSNADIPAKVKSELFNKVIQSIMQEQNQLAEYKKISVFLEENKIDFLPLKGIITKELYPKSEMRIMCDMDILINTEKYSIIRDFMLNSGYTEGEETDHELHWHKGLVTVEFHKRLVPNNPTSKDYADYFGIGWEKAVQSEPDSHLYRYSDEDFFVFSFAHFAKHYRERGIGVRHLVEIWVLLNAYKDMDTDYLQKELDKLDLYDFYINIVKTAKNWFENGEGDKITEHITHKVFTDGSYGIAEQGIISVAAQSVQTEGKVKNFVLFRIIRLIFPPLSEMVGLFPFMKKAPVVLPFMWVFRWFKIIFTAPKNIFKRFGNLKNQTNQKADEFNKELEFVGLKFR